MLFSERVILPSNANPTANNLRNSSNNNSKYEYISDKLNSLNNNSTSSSLSSNSSSSSASSSTSSANNSSLNGSNTYIEPKYSQLFQIKSPNTPGSTPKNPVFSSPRFSYLTLSPNARRTNLNNSCKKLDDQSSQYNKKFDSLNSKDNKYDQQRQSLIVNNNANNKIKTNQLNDRLLVAQTKMTNSKNSTLDTNLGAQIRNKQQNNKQPQSSSSYTYHTYNPNRLSSYDNDIYDYSSTTNSNQLLAQKQLKSDELDMVFKKNTLPTNQRASIAIPSSSTTASSKHSNIHFLKSCVNNNTNSKTTSTSNLFTRAFNYAFKKNTPENNAKLSWKSKLGKFFPQSVSSRKLNKEEGCDIIDDDLYESATYHLSRRQPIKKQSLNENLISTCSPLGNTNSNENNLSCLAGNNSSSAFSASFNDSTPYSANQTSHQNNNNNNNKKSSSKRGRAKCIEKTSSSTTNLNRSSPCLNKELNKNTNIINNGFNSLRKILKISNKQMQHKSNPPKCSSASSTPVPPSMKLNAFDKLKETKLIGADSPVVQIRNSLSSSNASLMLKQPQCQLQQQIKDNELAESKCSISKHGTNLTKSIINQTSSTFSSYSASLSSSLNDATSNKSKSNIMDNLDARKELDESKLSLTKQEANETKISAKLEEDKNKALKMLDYYKNSLSQNESKDVSNSTNNLKISSAEIFLTKNILINNDDSDYYEISKKTSENENAALTNTNNTNSNTTNNNTTNNNNTCNNLITKRQSNNDELVSTTTNNTQYTKTMSISNVNSIKKEKQLSSDEEILCDLEVASYFDDKQKYKNSDEESYYYENNQNENNNNNNNSDSKSSNNEEYDDDEEDEDDDDILDDVIDDELDNEIEDEDEDTSNLEYLVRQLAAEATLSLKGKKINVNAKNYNYENVIMNKKLEKDYPYENKPCVLKNKIFNCSNNNENNKNGIIKKYSTSNNSNNLISDDEEELIYDLESNFGLNDYINDVYNDDKIYIKSKNSKNELNNNSKFDDDYDYGSYSKSDTSDSLNGIKTSTLSFNILNGETIFNNNNNNSNINNNNNCKSFSKYNNKGFSSLRNKSKPNSYNLNPNFSNHTTNNNTNKLYDKKHFDLPRKAFPTHHKRSSSSSSCQQSHIVKLINHPQIQSQHQPMQRQLVQHQPRKDTAFNNNSIKIEKKIRLNYNRPQNYNSILNFGTLC